VLCATVLSVATSIQDRDWDLDLQKHLVELINSIRKEIASRKEYRDSSDDKDDFALCLQFATELRKTVPEVYEGLCS